MVEHSHISPKRGRPRDPDRLLRVLESAIGQFSELGFERTSMESVAQAAGVSKMTVYSYFASKEALFEACVKARCSGLFDLFVNATVDPAQPLDGLTRIGALFQALMRDEAVLATHRMMFGSVETHPALCQTFAELGPTTAVRHLAAYLAEAHRCGSLVVDDPWLAADQFLSLFLGSDHCLAMLGVGQPDPARDAARLAANVALFLKAYVKQAPQHALTTGS